MRPLFAAAILLTGCRESGPPPREFDGTSALSYIQTQLAFGPRIPGTAGHQRMAVWLDSLLRTRADSVVTQRWTHVTRGGDSLPMVNLIARFNPGATYRVLYLAHWDTRPKADAATSRDTTAAVPGANDGGSGVAILLGIADVLKRTPPDIGVDLLFVDGEDFGSFDSGQDQDVLIGSRYYAEHLLPGEPPRFAILFDMVGDKDLRIPREGNSVTGAPDVVDMIWDLADRLGRQSIFVPEDGGAITDDHVPLQQVGIRAIDLIDLDFGPENRWHHTPDDTIDKVSVPSLQAVGDVAMAVIREAKKLE